MQEPYQLVGQQLDARTGIRMVDVRGQYRVRRDEVLILAIEHGAQRKGSP